MDLKHQNQYTYSMKYFLRLIYVTVIGCLPLFSIAQEVFVYDADTKEPLAGVLVYNKDQSIRFLTALDGRCVLNGYSAKETLYINHSSYIEYRTNVKQWVQRGRVVYLQRNAFELDEVVMSVSKWEQQRKDVPQKIVGINAQSIAFNQPQTAADMLQQTGKVYVQKSQLGGGSPMIRGFAANRLLLSVDGVRMNNAIFRGGNLQNSIAVDPFSIKNTEVIFGSGSVIYGSDAIGGVVHYYTKEPQLSKNETTTYSGNAQYRYSSANQERTAHLDLSVGTEKWGFLSSITHSNFEDLQMGKNGPEAYLRPQFVLQGGGADLLVDNPNPRLQNPTGYNQINSLQKVRYKADENLEFQLGVYFSETSHFARYDRLTRPDNAGTGLRSAVWDYGPQKWFMTNFNISHAPLNTFYEGLKFTAAYQRFNESRFDRDFGAVSLFGTEEKVDAISFNLDIEHKKTGAFRLFYGAEYVGNKVYSKGSENIVSSNMILPAASRYPDNALWRSAALYLNSTFEASENFKFLGGIRYTHVWVNASFDNEFYDFPFEKADLNTAASTGSLGWSWFVAEDFQVNWNATTGFRAPNIDDIGKVFDSEPGSVVVPNPALKPEYAYGTEIGLKKNFSDKVVWRLAGYYTHLKDALVRRNFALNGQSQIVYQGVLSQVQAVQNAANAYIYGWEIGADFMLSPYLSFAVNYSYIKGTEEEDNGALSPGRHVAPSFGDLQLLYKNSRFKASILLNFNREISADQLAVSEQSKSYMYALDRFGNPYSPSWHSLNFRSQYTLTNAVTTFLAWENITNQLYRTYASGLSAPGSNLILGASYQF